MLFATGTTAEMREGTLGDGYNWIRNASGKQYEAHDVGALFVMFPAALLGSFFREVAVDDWVAHPPFFIKAAASLTYALVAAGGAYCLFLLFALFHQKRTAFLGACAFVVTTPFWAFSRCGFDVLGGAAGVCMLLWTSARLLLARRVSAKEVAPAFGSLALACSFRYSLLPFLGLGLCGFLWLRRKDIPLAGYLAGGGTFLTLMLPTFVYNYVRMGNPLKPATVATKYLEGMNALTGNSVDGFYGLLFSPNWGLFFYAPHFVLLTTLPFVWKTLPVQMRQTVLIWGMATLGYLVPISHSVNWPGVVGWGSRYMVPVLPIFFGIAAIALSQFWARYKRPVLALVGVSFLVNLPSGFVNWHEASLANASAPWEEQIRYPWARGPRQQAAVWRGFLDGLRGIPLHSNPEWSKDPALYSIIAFPDLWTFRLMRMSPSGLAAGCTATLLLVTGGISCGLRLVSIRETTVLRDLEEGPCGLGK
ncbi:MAG: hypothetical protein DVB28_000124 [Verrucomicrobia bacterium]|nr:MAG: hypothetical protein DVB28_000124 [Verrucomicrobiota bacterium]